MSLGGPASIFTWKDDFVVIHTKLPEEERESSCWEPSTESLQVDPVGEDKLQASVRGTCRVPQDSKCLVKSLGQAPRP